MYINTICKPGAYMSQKMAHQVCKTLREQIETEEGDEVLFFEVIKQAVVDLSIPDKKYGGTDQANREEAHRFIFASDAFVQFCGMCGLSPKYVRRIVAAAVDHSRLAESA